MENFKINDYNTDEQGKKFPEQENNSGEFQNLPEVILRMHFLSRYFGWK